MYEGLRLSDRYTGCVKAAIPLPLQDLMANLHERLHVVWRELDGADPRIHTHKQASCDAWMALPLKPSAVQGPSHLLHRNRQLKLSRHLLCNIALFYLCAHTLRVETGSWQIHNRHCDKCDLHDVKDEEHVTGRSYSIHELGHMHYEREIQKNKLLILLGLI